MSDALWVTISGDVTCTTTIQQIGITPLKFKMEPKNHPIDKESHLPSTSIFGFKMLVFGGLSILSIHVVSFAANHLEPEGWHSHLRHGRYWWCSPGRCLGRWGHLEGANVLMCFPVPKEFRLEAQQ